MARKTFKHYRLISNGVSREVTALQFHKALDDRCALRLAGDVDRRRAYVRPDLRMSEDRETNELRFELREKPVKDAAGVKSWWPWLVESQCPFNLAPA